MARRSRRALRVVEEAVDVTEASDDEPTSCVVCEKLNTRVTVACDACAKVYHLACHSPPLRRRPAATAQWTCAACEDGDEAKEESGGLEHQSRPLGAKRRSSRNGVASEPAVESKEEEEKHENGGNARKRRRASGTGANLKPSGGEEASSAPKQSKAEVQDAEMSGSDAPLSKTVSPTSKPKQAKTTARKKLPSRTTLKVQEPELAAERSTRALQRSRGPASGRKIVTLVDSDEDMEEEDGDDDNDSDFEEADETEEDDNDDSADNVSDEDFQAPVKLPTRAKSPTKPKKSPQPKKSPNGKGKKAATPTKRGNTASPADDNATNASTQAGADSMEPDVDQESEEEEEYTGPQYSVEYSPNARSKCKDCEEKIVKDELRVGVFVRHSMFGMTTYYKHLKCSQICWDTAEKLRERAQKAAEAAAAAATAAAQTDSDEMIPSPSQKTPSNEPIRGFASLKPKEQEIVRAHMTENMNAGVLDERLELTEDQYNRKTRMPEKDPSPHLTVPLLPYQREALAWMTEQEKSEYKGGILADEMGMGKTIQAISLILESPRGHPSKAEPRPTNKGKGRAGKTADPVMPRGGTLVVCPVVAVMQWKSEIERFVERNHLSIYIHHGQKRLDHLEKIASYDIVLTTYSIIEAESRKSLGWEKVACRYCKKKYLPDKLVLHNKYFCGPNAKKTALQDRQVTKKKKQKKAAGESSSEESEDDLKKPVKGKTAPKRKQPLKKKAIDSDEDGSDSDVADKPIRKAKQGKSPLHSIHWARIVLDEAHYIKDRRCNTARGVFELKSDYKWCLTGTPLQNRIGELFSLVRFLQVKFYAYYHCNKCECQMLDYDFPDNKCAHCDHPAMHHFSYFNKKIVIPIQSYGYVAEGKVAMLRLQNEVLQHILLRRTKEGRADDIALPPKLIRIRRDRLDERENDFYQAIYTQSQAQFNTYVSSGTLLNNYAHIFDLLIRLRQAVDHPYLVIYSKSNPALQMPVAMDSTAATFIRPVIEQKPLISHTTDDDDGDKSPGANEVLCAICHEDVEDPVTAKCRHVFCRECVKEFIESLPEGASATCPTCEKALTVDLSPSKPSEDFGEPETPTKANVRRPQVDLSRYHKHSILHRISDMASFQTSTKIEALMQELEHMKARDPSGKAIIFSQFVNLLDIIQHRLTLGGIKCVKLSGNMTMDARDRTIRAFREDNSISAFLISLKAGGVALNLTIASHIFLMDPWWNPAAENQAIDRTHRLGQFKPVEATRFIIAGTIEERILKLQEKKRLIFEGTVGASVSAICRLTEEDLRFLFSK